MVEAAVDCDPVAPADDVGEGLGVLAEQRAVDVAGVVGVGAVILLAGFVNRHGEREDQIPYLKAAYAKKMSRLVWDDEDSSQDVGCE